MSEDSFEQTLEDLRAYVDGQVRGGFMPVGEIPEAAVEYLSDDAAPDALRPYAEAFTAEALVAHSEDEKTWPAVTDCDRLDAAFAALEASGVLARQDYSCCQNCGHDEMWQEVEAARDSRPELHGYAFYHAQDTERATEGGGLYIAYGATEPGEEPEAQVGREIVSALTSQGLEVVWDGSHKSRVFARIDWKRRRP